jgi:hypothetical protein
MSVTPDLAFRPAQPKRLVPDRDILITKRQNRPSRAELDEREVVDRQGDHPG